MTPQYFMHSLTLAEATDYITGQDRRGRASWEQCRAIVYAICGNMSGQTPDWTFPWDDTRTEAEKKRDAEQEAKDWAKLEAMAKQLNEQNKNKK